mmetsp:Transcript_40608/g.76105  ORF Transcript_40608/g.76105 Transcript_40608/m.76105 type:complete len:81 (+) Transcript_40608:208-450(+)
MPDAKLVTLVVDRLDVVLAILDGIDATLVVLAPIDAAPIDAMLVDSYFLSTPIAPMCKCSGKHWWARTLVENVGLELNLT